MPNNPSNARSMLNMVRGPSSALVAPRPVANASTAVLNSAPAMSETEARVQKAYENMGMAVPVGTTGNPVRMSAGGIIGDVGVLNAARMGIRPRITPEQQTYMDQYNVFVDQQNNEFLPAYEDYIAKQNAWADSFNKATQTLASGSQDRRVRITDWQQGQQLIRSGWRQVPDRTSSNHYFYRPPITSLFGDPEPTFNKTEPVAPALPQGFTDMEQFQQAVGQEAQQGAARRDRALSAFANPQAYNLAGFAGASAFKDGGDVKKLTETSPREGGLSYRDYPNPDGLRAYDNEAKDGFDGEMLPKGPGWAGELKGKGPLKGKIVTEYSMEDEKGSFPTVTPLLSMEELELVATGIVTPSIYKKAQEWRDMQAEKGASPFRNPEGFKKGGVVTDFIKSKK